MRLIEIIYNADKTLVGTRRWEDDDQAKALVQDNRAKFVEPGEDDPAPPDGSGANTQVTPETVDAELDGQRTAGRDRAAALADEGAPPADGAGDEDAPNPAPTEDAAAGDAPAEGESAGDEAKTTRRRGRAQATDAATPVSADESAPADAK